MQKVQRKMQNGFLIFCVLNYSFFIAGCSIPSLESPTCIAARPAVREFYSFHFGNDMRFSPENLKLRERFISPGLASRLVIAQEGTDPFTTGTEELPKAFRDGECHELSADRASFRVLLFWKDDVRTEQRPITVEVSKLGDKWLIDRVTK